MKRPAVPAAILVALALAASLAACGGEEHTRTFAETEGIFVEVGELSYQVQVSRQLNPADPEDRAYFTGLDESEVELEGDETWFGIFLLAFNETDEPQEAADEFEIEDTAAERYEPTPLPEENSFAWHGGTVPPNGSLPRADTAARDSVIGGSLVLFELPVEALGKRPLELTITRPGADPPQAVIDIDV